jgi:hypothetical protein
MKHYPPLKTTRLSLGKLFLNPRPDRQLGWLTEIWWSCRSFPPTFVAADTWLATRLLDGFWQAARGKVAVR